MENRFSICDYLLYIKGTDTSRVVYEGEHVLNAGHIILCGVTNKEENRLTLYALCLQTSALQSAPHKIEGTLVHDDEKWVVEKFACSCKAGQSGRCKHISAVLLQCSRTSLDKLEAVSQTDIKCTWSAQKGKTQDKYRAIPVKEMPCIKQSDGMKLDEAILMGIHDNLVSKLPNSALALHKAGRRCTNLSTFENEEVFTPYDEHDVVILNHATQSILMMELYHFHVNFIGSCCKELFDKHLLKDIDEILLKTKQSKEFWNIERKFRVTGSRIYELYTYKSDDWQKKANRYFNPISFMNKFTKHGIEQEPVARQIFMDATGLKVVECGLVVSHFNSWLGYSPDGIIVDQDGNPKELIEIKCPFAGATETIGSVVPKLKYLQLEDNIYELKKKHKYFAQVQLGMAMLNVFNCKFIIYCSFDKSMLILDVPYNYDFSKTLLFNVKGKYFKKMLHVMCNT